MQLGEANWIRVYSILSVVVWHCFTCPIALWGLLQSSVFTKFVGAFSFFLIPQANMPLFTCLSGYLFAHLYISGKKSYSTFYGILENKFKRLVVPFLVIGTIATAVVPERPLISGIIWGDGSSLWFCIMLFWLTLLRWLIVKVDCRWFSITFFLFTVIVYMTDFGQVHWLKHIPIGVFCFGRAFHYYLFFVLGGKLFEYREFLFERRVVIRNVFIFAIYVVVGVLSLLKIHYVSFICMKLMPVMLIFVVFIVFSIISEKTASNSKIGGVVSEFCRHSFGIYVLHEAFSWNCYHNQTLLPLFRSYPLLYAASFTLFTLILCYVLTHYLLKTKLGRVLFK